MTFSLDNNIGIGFLAMCETLGPSNRDTDPESGSVTQTILFGLASLCIIWAISIITGWKWLLLVIAVVYFSLGFVFRNKRWNLLTFTFGRAYKDSYRKKDDGSNNESACNHISPVLKKAKDKNKGSKTAKPKKYIHHTPPKGKS